MSEQGSPGSKRGNKKEGRTGRTNDDTDKTSSAWPRPLPTIPESESRSNMDSIIQLDAKKVRPEHKWMLQPGLIPETDANAGNNVAGSPDGMSIIHTHSPKPKKAKHGKEKGHDRGHRKHDRELPDRSVTPADQPPSEGVNVSGRANENEKQGRYMMQSVTPSVAAITNVIPPDALKLIRIQQPRQDADDTMYTLYRPTTPAVQQTINLDIITDRPVGAKLLILKHAPPMSPPPPEEEEPEKPWEDLTHSEELIQLEDIPEDKEIDKKLTEMLNIHREYLLRKLKRVKKDKGPRYRFPEMIDCLTEQGIPCPVNEDFGRLQGMHSRWDPKGTVLEYYSPMLRAFVPVNMRGRYRGSWNTDNCVKGLNISSIPPKRDAFEGFIDRGRHNNIQAKYDDMSSIAEDEAHLDYLIEIQSYHSETLPIPIFYDMLHFGMEVANENLRTLVQEDGYPPDDPVFISAHDHAEQLRRKIQMYGALGLETLESERKGLGQYRPEWLKSRDEIIRDIMKMKDEKRFAEFLRMEKEALEKGDARREETRDSFGSKRSSRSKGSDLKAASNLGEMNIQDSAINIEVINNKDDPAISKEPDMKEAPKGMMGSKCLSSQRACPTSTTTYCTSGPSIIDSIRQLGPKRVRPEHEWMLQMDPPIPSCQRTCSRSTAKCCTGPVNATSELPGPSINDSIRQPGTKQVRPEHEWMMQMNPSSPSCQRTCSRSTTKCCTGPVNATPELPGPSIKDLLPPRPRPLPTIPESDTTNTDSFKQLGPKKVRPEHKWMLQPDP